MEVLARIWEIVGELFGGLARGIERGITSIFGSSNARYVRRLQGRVAAINALEGKFQGLSDEELRDQTRLFRERLAAGETLDDLLVEAFAVCREGGRRFLGMRHYDVQLMGGMVLHSGAIAEMVTGEGKTLVATLPTYLNALAGSVHVVTVNDYLARRDMEWMGPLYQGLGLSVGAIQSGMEGAERQRAYACDITYGTNNEFGFDYLRDNMRPAARGDERYPHHLQQVQGPLTYAVIDEVDNILVDEARTPLIISGPARDDVTKYSRADRIARQLRREEHFEIKEKEHTVHLTEAGVREAERLAGVESFYTAGNMEWPHLIDNSLKAHHLYKRDVNYVVQGGEVVIVDEFTGRLMPGRNWSDGLHQAVEAKEGVTIKEENQTLATITLQNFFKLYQKISGMTGTAMTEASEFWKIYKLDVVAIPTNRSLQRINHPDVIFRTEKEKYQAIVEEIERLHKWDVVELKDHSEKIGTLVAENDASLTIQNKDTRQNETVKKDQVAYVSRRGRPILVGTVSIEKSERISGMLDRRGIVHQVLNAKHHQREAEIVAQAGRKAGVTIATNMAGRGTDIVLGGNPETMAWAQLQHKYPTRLDVPQAEWNALVAEIEAREQMKAEGREVAGLGGLMVIGTERHEARRIDLQLRGRCGRQGDPGASRFYLSLEDDLMRIFAGEWVKNVLTRLGMQEGEAIESRMVSRRIEAAQRKVEERNFEVRKNLLEYDEVMDEQRKRVYGYRQSILDGTPCKDLILEMVDQEIDRFLAQFLDPHYGLETFAAWAGSVLSVELEGRDLRGMDFDAAVNYAKDQAQRQAETQIFEAIEENLPEDEDPSEWNWEALAKLVQARWGLHLRDRDLKRVGRDGVGELLIRESHRAIAEVDCGEGRKFLADDFGLQTTVLWVQHKLGSPLPWERVQGLEPGKIKDLVRQLARETYDQKEVEFPVLAGLYRFTTRDANGQKRFDREKLVAWARERFAAEIGPDDVKATERDHLRQVLLDCSRQQQQEAQAVLGEVHKQVDKLFDDATATALRPAKTTVAAATGGNGALDSLTAWIRRDLHVEWPKEELAELDRGELERRLTLAVDDRFSPEMRRMERALLLQILDAAWKDHLLAMDHLRSSVGLRSYAQVDPKVEYKREGMRTFDQMWRSVAERVTDLVYRIEQLDERFVGSMWVERQAIHESAPPPSDVGQQQKQAIEGTESQANKVEPIRNRAEKVGRNDPCPCGSGKKYKNCCLRHRGGA